MTLHSACAPSWVRSVGESVPVAVAGGTDDGRIGTSYQLIADAITAVDRGAGVLVLTDLGSAVLTARAVLADRVGRGRCERRRAG